MMKKHVLMMLLAILPGISIFASGEGHSSAEKQLKVLSWNVWHGGHTKAYPEKACRNTIEILKKSGADVILMVETYGAAPMVSDSLKYDYALISDNLCVYSRYPIKEVLTYPDTISTFHFGGVEIDLEGTPVRVFDTWLHYLPDIASLKPEQMSEAEILAWETAGTRDDELRKIFSALTDVLSQSDSIPVIMGGDFNVHSHLDWTEQTKNLYGHGGKVVGWPVSEAMEKAGFIDSFRAIHPDPVTNPGFTWLYDLEGNPVRTDRIDFIYCKGKGIRTVASEVFNQKISETLHFEGEDFFYPSDHGFVLSTFCISPANR